MTQVEEDHATYAAALRSAGSRAPAAGDSGSGSSTTTFAALNQARPPHANHLRLRSSRPDLIALVQKLKPSLLLTHTQPTNTTNRQAAVAQAKAGDHVAAIATLTRALDRAAAGHLTHPHLLVCYSNRAASHLAVEAYGAALADADSCLGLLKSWAEAAGTGGPQRHPSYPKALLRRGRALLGLERPAAAAAAFEAGLAADPGSSQLAEALAGARRRLRASEAPGGPEAAVDGGGRLLPAAGAAAAAGASSLLLRIGYAPRDAPLALLGGGGLLPGADDYGGGPGSLAARRTARVEGAALPASLLRAARAAEDRTLSEVYEYVRVQVRLRSGGAGCVAPRMQIAGCWLCVRLS
jgi:tetratricopeptide (TPR) repeat protein